MTGGTSAFRRLGRSVTRIPIVGSSARAAYATLEHRLWVHVFTPARYRRLAAANKARDFVNARAHTARNVTRGNSRSAYQKLYSSDKLLAEYLAPERLDFYDVVAAVAAELEPSSVVDVGCGTGHLLRALLDRREIADAAGFDYAPAAIERARRLVPEGTFTVGDLHTFDAGRTFEAVLCTEVLEHVEDPGSARDALARLVSPGGHVVATVPDGDRDEWEGHANFWSREEFGAFLDPLGAVDVRVVCGDVLLAVVRAGRSPDA
jgi:2-polyprenyl-3-methyl-5-hydroxy-6-metoxy-1,4-benzoquinol methylase